MQEMDRASEYDSFSAYNGSIQLSLPVDNNNLTISSIDETAENGDVNRNRGEFEAYSTGHLLAMSICMGLIILITIIGNAFVIAAIILEKNLQNVQNYLILSLGVADLMVAALVMPLALLGSVSKNWFLGSEMCDIWVSFDVICCTSSILHLVCIALDRYWSITRIDYMRSRTAKRILVMIALSWIISLCISIPPLFGWDDEMSDPDITGICVISQDEGYTIYSTVGAFYLPLFFLLLIYCKIYKAARSRIRKRHFQAYKDLASNLKPLIANNLNGQQISMKERTQCNNITEKMTTVGVSDTNGTAHTPLVAMASNNSPEASSNGSHSNGSQVMNDNKKAKLQAQTSCVADTPSPPDTPVQKLKHEDKNKTSSILDITKAYLETKNIPLPSRKKKHIELDKKEKMRTERERKAARTLAIITGTFVICWLPFFIWSLVRPFCGDKCAIPFVVEGIIVWLGYFNSLLNPVIYTIFNPDFRMAFQKIIFGQYKDSRNVKF